MTRILLIRHGDNDYVGNTLVGWTPGIHLNELGKRQAARIAERLGHLPIRALYTSPLERTRETAQPLAERLGLEVTVREDAGELHLGDWTMRRIDELGNDPEWRRFLTERGSARIPGGEMMIEVEARMVRLIEELRQRHVNEMVAVFSHGDPLRSVLCHYLPLPLDLMGRIEVGTGSVSVLEFNGFSARVIRINDSGDLP